METTDEFMARFRATGLDMLTEMRRREEHGYAPRAWAWTPGVTRSFSMQYPNYQSIPRDEVAEAAFVMGGRWGHRNGPVMYDTDWSNGDLRTVRHLGDGVEIDVHKSAALGWTAIDIDFSTLEDRINLSVDFAGAQVKDLDETLRSIRNMHSVELTDRVCLLSRAYQRQAAAAILASSAFNDMGSSLDLWKPEPTPQPIQYKTWSKNDPVRFGNNKAWKGDRNVKKKLAKASRKRNRK